MAEALSELLNVENESSSRDTIDKQSKTYRKHFQEIVRLTSRTFLSFPSLHDIEIHQSILTSFIEKLIAEQVWSGASRLSLSL